MADLIDRQAAIDAIRASALKYTGFMEMEMYTDDDAVEAIEGLPSVRPEPCEDRLKEIAEALSEKMCYMNTCLNERDIILGYLGVKRPSETHCNSDCQNEKCESYHYATKKLLSAQPGPPEEDET